MKLTLVSGRLATLLLVAFMVAATPACTATPTPVAPTAVVVAADTATPVIVVVTATPAPPTSTSTAAPATATNTVAPPTGTATVAPPTATAMAPTATTAPGAATATTKATATPVPPTVTPKPSPTPACTQLPVRGFGKVWTENQSARDYLGCATGGEAGVDFTAQRFEKGVIFFTGATADFGKDAVLVLFGDTKTWTRIAAAADAVPAPIGSPPAGKFAPAGRIGWVWQNGADVRTRLGWATAPEKTGKYGDASNGAWEPFSRGFMYYIPWPAPDGATMYVVAKDKPNPPGGSRADWLDFKDTFVP
jgi:hypothetical protein